MLVDLKLAVRFPTGPWTGHSCGPQLEESRPNMWALSLFLASFGVGMLSAGPDLLIPNEYWLPGEVVPVDYDFKLVVHMENLTTRGEVKIGVEVVQTSSTITLHANSSFIKINHDNVAVQGTDGGAEIPVMGHKEDEEKEFYEIKLGSQVKAGQRLSITLPYTGLIRDGRTGTVIMNSTDTTGNITNHHGFYVSTDGEWGLMGLTKFEPNGARKALPCFDEPHLKATFTVSLARPKQYSSLGNMPSKEEGVVMEEDEGYLWDHYPKSVNMSTYLLKWVVSKYGYAEAVTKRGVKVRAFYGKNATESMSYAAQNGAKIIDHLEQVFKMEYQLPKMDMVTVPLFRYGAMEEWGLMSFHMKYLQHEEEHNSRRFWVDLVVSHELVHQWAGNLVTCAW